MAMALGGRGGASSEMNVTPLIDVLLVLLIINMILLPHSVGERTLITQESVDMPPKPPEKTIVIQVRQTAEGQRPTLKINQDAVTWDTLGDRLTEIYKTRAEKIMFVKGDDDITFDNVAQVIDIAHSSGVDKIGLITAKIESGQ